MKRTWKSIALYVYKEIYSTRLHFVKILELKNVVAGSLNVIIGYNI